MNFLFGIGFSRKPKGNCDTKSKSSSVIFSLNYNYYYYYYYYYYIGKIERGDNAGKKRRVKAERSEENFVK